MEQIDVKILDRDYRLAVSPDDRKRLLEAVAVVDEKMRSIRDAGKISGLDRIAVSRAGELLTIDVEANAFLLHMVRNIAGSLLAIGTGERAPQWLAAVLESRDRTLAGATAPAQGLYLVDVGYDARHGLPRPPAGPWFAC